MEVYTINHVGRGRPPLPPQKGLTMAEKAEKPLEKDEKIVETAATSNAVSTAASVIPGPLPSTSFRTEPTPNCTALVATTDTTT